MTVEWWNELIQLYEQRRLTLTECRSRLKEQVEAAKGELAADGHFIATVTQRLRDKNFRIRILASEALGALACPAVIEPLLQTQDRESSGEVRRVIRSALLAFPESCLAEFLRLRNIYLAHEVLIHMGLPVVEPICELLPRVTGHDKDSLVSILRQIGDPRAGRALEAAYVADRHGRSYILDALLRTGLPHPIPIIRHAISDREWGLRLDGTKLAGTLGISELVPEIQVALRDVEAPVRRSAEEALSALKTKGEPPAAAKPVVTIPEVFIADGDSALIIDLRDQNISDDVAEMFLLPIRAENVGPFDSYEVQYCRCRPIELHKNATSGSSIEGVMSSLAVPLPAADMTDSLAEKGIPVIVPREFYIQSNDKNLCGRISRRDAESLREREEPIFAAENFPLRQPVLIALPARLDDIAGRASIRIQQHTKPRNPATMLFERAFGLPSKPTLDETAVPRPYWSFQTQFGGSEWLSAEIECIRRAFAFGRVKKLVKGRHKGEIQIVSPGAGQKGTELRTGLFERHFCADAFRVEREHRPVFDRSGMFSALFAYSDMPGLPFPFLNQPSTIIGISLGLTVAVWNAMGRVWIDLWHAYEREEEGEGADFLEFYRQFQKVRLNIPAQHLNLADIVEKAVTSVAASVRQEREALAVGSDARRALLSVRLGERQLSTLSGTFEKWDVFRRLFLAISEKRDPRPVDLESYGDLSREQKFHALLDGMDNITKFSDIKTQVTGLIGVLEFMGVRFDVDAKGRTPFHFSVTAERNGSTVSLEPCVHFGSPGKVNAHGAVMLLHELGHAALHSRYMGELALMHFCADRIEGTRPFTSARVRDIVSSARRRMIRMHSAIERAADRFALRFLLTPSFVEQLRMAFVVEGGGGSVRIFALDTLVQIKLGVDRDTYYRRFGPLIWPSLGMGGMATEGALPLTPTILDAMDRASARRIEKLLQDHWGMVRTALEQPETADRSTFPSLRQSVDLSFDGIECEYAR